METLQQYIMESIQAVPVELWWKMTSLGMQGPMKQENQVKALYIYVGKVVVEAPFNGVVHQLPQQRSHFASTCSDEASARNWYCTQH